MSARTCSNCGFENIAGARFCANCGKPQEPDFSGPVSVLTREALKPVTVLFADLAASTALTESLDPEDAREVVGQFYELVREEVERLDGTVANLLGDGVLAVFGFPTSHEDDPERAVRAALAIRKALPSLNQRLRHAHGVQLDLRIGINTGEVVAASGSTFDRDFLVSDAVTTAARLQQVVEPGTVVVGERTYRRTADAIDYRSRPPLQVKGKREPLAVWEALAAFPERREQSRIASPLIGRSAHLAQLRVIYNLVRDEGTGHFLTVIGPTGVGKSRLLREFLAEVEGQGTLVLRGRSLPFGGHIGYQPLIDILRAQAMLMDTDAPDVVRTKIESWLVRAVPADLSRAMMESLFVLLSGGDEPDQNPERGRQRLFDTWRTLLAALGHDRPLILVADGLQWADEGMLDLLEFLAGHLDDAHLLIVGVGRPDLLERRPHWGALARNATKMTLRPLGPEDAERLVGTLGAGFVALEMQRTIVERAEGNPLFIEELVRMLAESSTPPMNIPDTVQAVLTARIDGLPSEVRRVLQAAAVMGRSFWPSPVGALAGLSPEAAETAIQLLIAKDLAVRRGQSTLAGENEYAFRHVLTRDVAYGMLPRSQRQRAHAEAARWLESRSPDRVEEVVEVLADHLRLAGDDARAAPYLLRASTKARRIYANAEALTLYGQALEAAERAGLPPGQLGTIYRDRGEVRQLLGDYVNALQDFERGLDHAREARNVALEAVLENRIGLIHHRQVNVEEAEERFRRSAALARQAGDKLTLGVSLIDLANIAWDRGHIAPDDAGLHEGITLLRETGDMSSVARGLNMLAMVHFMAGNGPPAVAAAEDALAAARQSGDKSREATALSYLCTVHGFLGHHAEAIRVGQAAVTLATVIGDRRRVAFSMSFLSRPFIAMGELGKGIALLEESLPLIREVARVHLPFHALILGALYYHIGNHARAREVLGLVSEVEPAHPTWRQAALIAGVYIARLDGDRPALQDAIDKVLALPFGIFIADDADSIPRVVEVLFELGRLDDVRRLLGQYRALGRRFDVPGSKGWLAIMEADLAAAEGRQDEAVRHLDRALEFSQAGEGDVFVALMARERLVKLRGCPRDRDALRVLLNGLADSLPEELRAVFLSTPRASLLRGAG